MWLAFFSSIYTCFSSSGGLFDNNEEENIENAFKYAVYRVSHERGLLIDTKLMYDIQRLPVHNSFDASKKGIVHITTVKFPY